jgi:hypothetical protein
MRRIGKPFPQRLDLGLKVLGLEQLMGESDECEVKEGRDEAVLEAGGFRQSVPETIEVGGEGRLEVGERGRADVVPNDEKEESLVLGAVVRVGG